MTEIVPDFRAYCKQDKPPSYNDLGQITPSNYPHECAKSPLWFQHPERRPALPGPRIRSSVLAVVGSISARAGLTPALLLI